MEGAGPRPPQRATLGQVALPVALLWAICLLDYGRLVLPGPWPRQYVALSDLSRQFYPFQRFVAQRLAAGQLPTWNPYLYAGHPQLADPQTAVFSPLGLLLNLTAGHNGLSYLALEWRAVLDYMLAALFAYLFFQRLSRSTVGGLTGAICFTFGGFLSSYPLPQLPVLESALWLPLLLYCVDRALASARHGAAWAAAAGLTGGALVLAGHAQTAMLAAYATAAFAVYRVIIRRPAWRAMAQRAVLAAGIAGGIAALQLLPTLAFAGESTRAHLTFAEAGGGYDWHDYVELLFPGGLFQRTYYFGILPLALAVVAATRRAGAFWLGLFLVSAVVAMGARTPLFRLLYIAGPGFAAFRDQERAAAIAAFACCALAAQGAAFLVGWSAGPRPRDQGVRTATGVGETPALPDRSPLLAVLIALPTVIAAVLLWPQGSTPGGSVEAMPRPLNAFTAVLLAVTAVALLVLARRRTLPARTLGALIVAVTALNLLSAGAQLNRADGMPSVAPAVAATLRWLSAQPAPFRAGNSSDDAITNNLGTQFQIAGPFGDSPIEDRRAADLIAAAGSYRTWQLFNVRYVVTRRPPGEGFLAVHREGDLVTYAMQYGLPPAWAVRDIRPATSPDQAQQLTVALPQPGTAAVVEEQSPLAIAGPSPPRSQQETWLRCAPGDLLLTATTSDNAMLVISEPYVHGWAATVDGRPTPLYHADAALMAVALPAGSHTVALRYQQPGLRQGIALAALALLLALATFGQQWSSARRRYDSR
ncbi:MAG: YfhO family protein [Chloroflexota bacterium]